VKRASTPEYRSLRPVGIDDVQLRLLHLDTAGGALNGQVGARKLLSLAEHSKRAWPFGLWCRLGQVRAMCEPQQFRCRAIAGNGPCIGIVADEDRRWRGIQDRLQFFRPVARERLRAPPSAVKDIWCRGGTKK
jgi:hypothetical protein